MIRTTITFTLACLLAACATVAPLPPPPAQQAADGARVGVVVVGLDRSAIHQHVGTTVFNNFTADKTLPWHLGDRVKDSLTAELTKRGLTPVVLEAGELKQTPADKLVVNAGSQGWEVPAASKDVVRSLQENHKIDALVLVTAQPTLTSLECTGGPCTSRVLPKTGLFTRSVFNLNNYYVVPGYQTQVLSFRPAANLSSYDPMVSAARDPSRMIQGDLKPKDPRTISDAEFVAVIGWIDEYTQRVAAAAAESIKSGAKLPK